MKKMFVILLLAASVITFGRTYKNVSNKHRCVSYSFQLVRKLNDSAGIFTPCYDSITYVDKAVGNSLSARGGGGGKIIKTEVRDSGSESDVVLVGYNLQKMADGDALKLRDGQTLYQIGVHATPRGRSLAVFSLNKSHKVEHYLPTLPPPKGPAAGAAISCPHCGKKITITPSK